jgi:ribokinase
MSVCVLGSINLDIVASVENLPCPGETISAHALEHFPGGKGGNQAVASARMGVDTLMVGAVGADDPGEKMYAYLAESGVDVSAVLTKPEQLTGQAFINVSASGENAIVIVPGANAALGVDDISSVDLASYQVFLAQLESPLKSIEALFKSAAAKQGTTILNAAPAIAEGANLFSLVDILIVNETELATYSGLNESTDDQDAVINAAQKLLSHDGQTIVVTLGAKGVVVVDKNSSENVQSLTVEVLDTTGAGAATSMPQRNEIEAFQVKSE